MAAGLRAFMHRAVDMPGWEGQHVSRAYPVLPSASMRTGRQEAGGEGVDGVPLGGCLAEQYGI